MVSGTFYVFYELDGSWRHSFILIYFVLGIVTENFITDVNISIVKFSRDTIKLLKHKNKPTTIFCISYLQIRTNTLKYIKVTGTNVNVNYDYKP